ncbi:MAG: hypothetical protein ACLFPD_01760 [Desulfosudaceae bacterium]
MTPCRNIFGTEPAFRQYQELLPPGICPYLFYTLVPYIVTLAEGGWFNWVVHTADSSRRRSIRPLTEITKNLNRAFPNEVLVGCPHPEIPVIAGVGPGPNRQIRLRLLRGDARCPAHPEAGAQFLLTSSEKNRALCFYQRFPQLLLHSQADMPPAEAVKRFDSRPPGIAIDTVVHPCRYHKTPASDLIGLVPDHCCPHVFWHIYPRVLARMYNARPAGPIRLAHPGTGQPVTVHIEKQATEKTAWRHLAETAGDRLLRLLRRPQDRQDFTMSIRSVDGEDTGSPQGAANGCRVNLDNQAILCPAAFATLYPYLLLIAAGAALPWINEEEANRAACPDCTGIRFALRAPS